MIFEIHIFYNYKYTFYYLIFNNTKNGCTKDEYDEIIVGYDYTMDYKTNKLTENNKLVKIYEAEDLLN